jgi:CelD/BcsL family acetyltransferase involved in cellulose biosynthesis
MAALWSAADQVPDWPAPHPFGSREWALAWRNVQTDPVRAARVLHAGRLVAPFYLIDGSPAWAAFEAEAGVGDIWAGRPVVYGPSPYATYGLNLARPWEIRTVVEHGLAWAREAGAVAAVFPGLRHPRPWTAVESGIAVRTTGSHEAPVRGSMAAFKASIGSSRARREFGRQWRRANGAGLRLDALRGAEMTPILPAFTRLASAAAARHGVALYGLDLFHAVAQVPGAVLLAAKHGRKLAGGFLCLRHGSTLYLWAAGLDYATLPELHTYAWLLAESVSYAAATGAAVVDAGRGNYLVKRRLGFSQIPLYSVCYLASPDPGLAASLAEMGGRIAAALAQASAGPAQELAAS